MPRIKQSCCLDCHFDAEELELEEVLPAQLRRWLRVEHRALRAQGMRPAAIKRHAELEEKLFAPHLTTEQMRWLRRDHVRLG